MTTWSVVTWNVNSVRRRLDGVEQLLARYAPDLLLLQETKVVDGDFPVGPFELADYEVQIHGQKSYNGVAIASRQPLQEVVAGLPGMDAYEAGQQQARLLTATVGGLQVASVYVPNGQRPGVPKYAHKLEFLTRLRDYLAKLGSSGQPVVVGGDYNVAPTNDDVYDIDDWGHDSIACSPSERAAYAQLLNAGYVDAHRALNGAPHSHTWWDYRAGSYRHDRGLRIDHFLVSGGVCRQLRVLNEIREMPAPSDHAPLLLQLDV